jgi:ABC-type lipoprotein release transport system permease subunit
MDDKTFKSLSKPQQDVVLKIAAEAERQGVNPRLAIAVVVGVVSGLYPGWRSSRLSPSRALNL